MLEIAVCDPKGPKQLNSSPRLHAAPSGKGGLGIQGAQPTTWALLHYPEPDFFLFCDYWLAFDATVKIASALPIHKLKRAVDQKEYVLIAKSWSYVT